MTTNVIYSGITSPYWRFVVEQLADENGWQPVYIVAGDNEMQPLRERFPGTVVHYVIDAVKGIAPPEVDQTRLRPLDTALLKEFEAAQTILPRMMDRIDAIDSMFYNDRVRLMHNVLRYWYSIVEEYQPERVVFSVIPHMVYDYALYVLCQLRGIPMLMFESIPVRGKTVIMDAYEKPGLTQRYYQDLLKNPPVEVSLPPELEDYLNALQGSYRDAPEYVRRIYKQRPYEGLKNPSKSLFSKLTDFENYARYYEKQMRILKMRLTPPKNYLKLKHKKLEDSQMNFFQYKWFRLRSNTRMRALIRHYHRLAEDVDLNQSYIYVALSFQPERTTCPMGSIYVDQYLMVDLLSKSVPEGWRVYVKDHPFQFSPPKFHRAQSGRTRAFYEDMAALPNVSLVPMPIDSYQMIDNAQAVAAVTGTVGWETIHRGKPALIFGYPWYRGCEGTFQITTQQSLLDALAQIQAGYRIDTQKLRLFSYALEQTAVKASVETHLQITPISDEERAARLVEAIQEFVAV